MHFKVMIYLYTILRLQTFAIHHGGCRLCTLPGQVPDSHLVIDLNVRDNHAYCQRVDPRFFKSNIMGALAHQMREERRRESTTPIK